MNKGRQEGSGRAWTRSFSTKARVNPLNELWTTSGAQFASPALFGAFPILLKHSRWPTLLLTPWPGSRYSLVNCFA